MVLAESIVSPSDIRPLNYICIHINFYVFHVILICILCNSRYSLGFFSDSPSVLLVFSLPHLLRWLPSSSLNKTPSTFYTSPHLDYSYLVCTPPSAPPSLHFPGFCSTRVMDSDLRSGTWNRRWERTFLQGLSFWVWVASLSAILSHLPI